MNRNWLKYGLAILLMLTNLVLPLVGSPLTSAAPGDPPTVTSVGPGQGAQGQTNLLLRINGTDFAEPATVSFGEGIEVASVTVVNVGQISAQITISATAAVGPRTVSVTVGSNTGTLEHGFTVNEAAGVAPTITRVITKEGNSEGFQGKGPQVTITGSNFVAGSTTVSFGEGITVDLSRFTVDAPTQITAVIIISDTAALGPRDVTVTVSGLTATLPAAFTVKQVAPTMTEVNPSQGLQGQTLSMTIKGGPFTGTSVVGFGEGISVNSFAVDSRSQITANVTISPTAKVGLRDISVTTPGGLGKKTEGFTVVELRTPGIESVNPDEGVQGQALTVSIRGGDFMPGTTLDFGEGITIDSYTVNGGNLIEAKITISVDAAPGSRSVSVANGSATCPKPRIFRVHALGSASGPSGGGQGGQDQGTSSAGTPGGSTTSPDSSQDSGDGKAGAAGADESNGESKTTNSTMLMVMGVMGALLVLFVGVFLWKWKKSPSR